MEITNSVMDDLRFRLLEQSYFTVGGNITLPVGGTPWGYLVASGGASRRLSQCRVPSSSLVDVNGGWSASSVAQDVAGANRQTC